MKEFFDVNEKQDLQMLYEFNTVARLFEGITPAKEKAQYDAIGYKRNRRFAIELKHRFINLDKYKSIMIEDYKFAALMMEYIVNQTEPLYVCFLQGGYILIYNLLKLTRMPQLRTLNIESKGYDKMQCSERRYLLSFDDAVIFKDNKMLKPMGETWKTQQYS